MRTLHTEILADDAPIDVYAENALRDQHRWLARYDQGAITASDRASASFARTRPSTDAWREELGSISEVIVYAIPVRLTPQVASLTVRLAGHTRSQASSPLGIVWAAYLALSPTERVEAVMSYHASQLRGVTLTLPAPRPEDTYEDLLIVTMRSQAPGAGEQWWLATDLRAVSDGQIVATGLGSLHGTRVSADSALYVEELGWYDVEGFDDATRGPHAYALAPTDSARPAGLFPITAYTPRAVALELVGYTDPPTISQRELRPNEAIQGQTHARHELLIHRAQDHRRPAGLITSPDVLTDSETSQTVRWRRAEYTNGLRTVVRESLHLDRGDYGRLIARLVTLSPSGGRITDEPADRESPDLSVEQTWRVRLLQHQDGSATPVEVYSGEQTLTHRLYAPRGYGTAYRALAGCRRWSTLKVSGLWHRRLEQYALTDRGTALRWGQLSAADLAVCDVSEIVIDLTQTTGLDADLPAILVVDMEDDLSQPAWTQADGDNPFVAGSYWRAPRFAAHIAVGGSIWWEAGL